jgi:hypothetical protein
MPKYTKQQLEEAVKNSFTISEALKLLNLRTAGGNYKLFKDYCKKWQVNTSHFLTYSEIAKRNWNNQKFNTIPLLEVLKENSSFNRTHLKERLYKEGLKKPICEIEGCGQGEEWLGKKMSLILDHINGIWNDNRIENLRIVCPNCNATLDTHSGKNIKRIKKIKQSKIRESKIDWPSVEELKNMVNNSSYVEVGKKLGVSDNAVRKRIKTRISIDT